jgi:hypothetical protein
MSRDADRLHPVDVAVLGHLEETGVDYPTCIAHRHEIPVADIEQRCAALAERELVEAVSHEVVYRITDAGRRRLAAYRTAGAETTTGAGETTESSERSPPDERARPGDRSHARSTGRR